MVKKSEMKEMIISMVNKNVEKKDIINNVAEYVWECGGYSFKRAHSVVSELYDKVAETIKPVETVETAAQKVDNYNHNNNFICEVLGEEIQGLPEFSKVINEAIESLENNTLEINGFGVFDSDKDFVVKDLQMALRHYKQFRQHLSWAFNNLTECSVAIEDVIGRVA